MGLEFDVAEMIWNELQRQIKELTRRIDTIEVRYERSEISGGVDAVTLANAPTTNVKAGSLVFVTDGRKSGEGAGAGSGVLAFWNPSTLTWKRVEDNADVVV